jgi:hypothetical protein
MLEMVQAGPEDVVYDLGCGDGRLIVAAAKRCGARAVGIEIDLLRFLWCQVLITVTGQRGRVRVRYGNLFKLDLSEATVVTVYLLPDTNSRLQHKLAAELNPDARVVSHSFPLPALSEVERDERYDLFLYRPVMNVARPGAGPQA